MDRVRLGRALGYGTRHAAKTLMAVAEAAATPDPQTPARPAGLRTTGARGPGTAEQPKPAQRRPTTAQVRGAGRSVWGPLATFSSALWLRVTGLFFGLIAFAMANGAWRLRGAVRGAMGSSGEAGHFWIFTGFAALFGYFAVSGFARARRRERTATAPR